MINSNAKFQFPNELIEQVINNLNYSFMDNRIKETFVGDFIASCFIID